MVALDLVRRCIANRRVSWVAMAAGLFFAYYAVLLVGVTLRFGELPNYVRWYDLIEAYRLIWIGTEAWGDVLPLLFAEPLVEVGFQNAAYYGIAEWSLTLVPPQASVTGLLSLLLSTWLVVRSETAACAPSGPVNPAAIVGVGSFLTSMTTATLSWIVCCATPSWVVALAMFGLSSSVALALEPVGPALGAIGIALVVGALALQVRSAATEDRTRVVDESFSRRLEEVTSR